jgi:hypothetical protein
MLCDVRGLMIRELDKQRPDSIRDETAISGNRKGLIGY